ncbi:MAG: FAD-dependent oxidoreductase [Anaerolineae bacterium]|nr:FAD-dependent oxidoreductase [Anaerolineae bacterium]
MSDVIIIGDGPGGLSAALFLAKNGQAVTVFGQDKTAMHWAMLYNYLGIPQILGSDFMKIAREQVTKFGADLRDQLVTRVERTGDAFTVITESGESHNSKYLIIAEGKGLELAKSLGLSVTDEGVEVDRDFRTSIDHLYVVGRSTRIQRSQAIISAGNGAAAALDILSTEKGKDFNDFDTPPKK